MVMLELHDSHDLARRLYEALAYEAPVHEVGSSSLTERHPPWETLDRRHRERLRAVAERLLRDATLAVQDTKREGYATISVYVEPDKMDRLRHLAADRGVAVVRLVREAIDGLFRRVRA